MLKKVVIFGVGLSFVTAAAAGEFLSVDYPYHWSSIITLSAGASWTTALQDQTLYPLPLPYYEYYNYDSASQTLASGEIFFGLQRVVYPNLIGQLGLGIAGVSDAKIKGFVNVAGLPDASSYSYKVNHARVELKGKLIGYTIQPFQPYVSGSFGAGFNYSHEYIPTQLNPFIAPPLWFQSNTTVAFAYSFGAGVQTMLNPNWQVGLGYQFSDLGKSFLNGDGIFLSKGLRLTHFYTHELLASISYMYS